MTNIKPILKKVILSAGFIILLGFPIYIVGLWAMTDFNVDFLKIDSCFDQGGRWNYESRECEFE